MARQDSPQATSRFVDPIFVLRDLSEPAAGLNPLLGNLLAGRVAFIDKIDDELGTPIIDVHPGLLEPHNWRRDDIRVDNKDNLDLRFAVQLIADRDNLFGPRPPKPKEKERPTTGGAAGGTTGEGDLNAKEIILIGGGVAISDPGSPSRQAVGPARGEAGDGAVEGVGVDGEDEEEDRIDTRPAYFLAKNRGTRVVDQFPEVFDKDNEERGEALLVSTLTVIDNLDQRFSCATVIGAKIVAGGSSVGQLPISDHQSLIGAITTQTGGAALKTFTGGGGDRFLGSGYNYDGLTIGTWWTLLHNNPADDIIGAGKRGSQIGITGIRYDAHFEYGQDHGALFLDPSIDLSDVPRCDVGILIKATLAKDDAVANFNTDIDHESTKWRPWYRKPYFFGLTGAFDLATQFTTAPGTTVTGTPTPVMMVMPVDTGGSATTGPSLVNVDNVTTQGHLSMVAGVGFSSDRTVLFTSQGDGVGPESWGMTLPSGTQFGVGFGPISTTWGDGSATFGFDGSSLFDINVGLKVGSAAVGSELIYDPFAFPNGLLTVNGDVFIAKKLTVVDEIDPTAVEYSDGSARPVSLATRGKQIYDDPDKIFKESIDTGAFQPLGFAGLAFDFDNSDALSTTTSTTFQNKLTLTTAAVLAGTYQIRWSAEVSNSVNAQETEIRCRLDGATDLAESQVSAEGADVFGTWSGFTEVALTAGVHTLDVDFRRISAGTAEIRRTRLALKRVA